MVGGEASHRIDRRRQIDLAPLEPERAQGALAQIELEGLVGRPAAAQSTEGLIVALEEGPRRGRVPALEGHDDVGEDLPGLGVGLQLGQRLPSLERDPGARRPGRGIPRLDLLQRVGEGAERGSVVGPHRAERRAPQARVFGRGGRGGEGLGGAGVATVPSEDGSEAHERLRSDALRHGLPGQGLRALRVAGGEGPFGER